MTEGAYNSSSPSSLRAKHLVIVDISNYLFRSYYAIRMMRATDGSAVNAVYGLASSLVALRTKYADAAFACAMDAPGPTFRNELYPDYKANRSEVDEDLKSQFAPSKELISALGMQLYCINGVEADDVIGTLAAQALTAKLKVTVATSDKDLMYLTARGAKIHYPKDSQVMNAAAVEKKFNVKSAQMLDYLAIVGDSSDNIPGVPGIGPKRASTLLNEYGSLDKLIEKQDELKGAMGDSFRKSGEVLKLSRSLVAVKEDVELSLVATELTAPEVDKSAITSLFDRLKFGKTLLTRVMDKQSIAAATRVPTVIINTIEQAKQLIEQLATSPRLGIYIETEGNDALTSTILGVALVAKARYYLPINHSAADEIGNEQQAAAAIVLQMLVEGKLGRNLIMFDVKTAIHALQNNELNLTRFNDAMVLAYSLDSEATGSLASLLKRYALQGGPNRTEIIGHQKEKVKHFSELPVEQAASLTGQWAADAIELNRHLMQSATESQLDIYDKFELPLVKVLGRMERVGMLVNADDLQKFSTELEGTMQQLTTKMSDHVGFEVNLNSPGQLSELLYEKLQLQSGGKTSAGVLSTKESELERLAETSDSPVPEWILEFRHAAKLHGTYTVGLMKRINSETGRIHTNFVQNGAVTGRLSSTNPNLQNIPIRTAQGRRIRQCFITKPGTKIVSADYSQIELKILAHFSKDKTLLDAFANSEDVHIRTAAEIFSIDIAEVSNDQRRYAKMINYGLIYGMSEYGLAKQMGITRAKAKQIIDSYFQKLTSVREFLDSLKAQAAQDNYVVTACGRKINFTSAHRNIRSAINAPMQGTAADIMKLAMIDIDEELMTNRWESKMLLQVHDELLFEAPEAEVESLKSILEDKMSTAYKLSVPLTVDVGVGDNWDEAH